MLIVPALVRVRPSRTAPKPLPICSVAPPFSVKLPLPVTLPPFQMFAPESCSADVPERLPTVKVSPLMVAVPTVLSATLPPLIVTGPLGVKVPLSVNVQLRIVVPLAAEPITEAAPRVRVPALKPRDVPPAEVYVPVSVPPAPIVRLPVLRFTVPLLLKVVRMEVDVPALFVSVLLFVNVPRPLIWASPVMANVPLFVKVKPLPMLKAFVGDEKFAPLVRFAPRFMAPTPLRLSVPP